MRIVRVTTRNIRFDKPPATLNRHLVTITSQFEDCREKASGWFGDVVFTLVEVESSDGQVGRGTAGGFQGASKTLIDHYYADLVLGEDPRRHEHLWQRMHRTTLRFGRSGNSMAAIAAIDIACWDLHGKALGVPTYELIGGAARCTAPSYVSRLYALDDLSELSREARQWKDAGFRSMKQRFGFGPPDGIVGMKKNVELVKTVREAVGDEIQLSCDAYMGWDVGYAIEMAHLLRDYGVSWIEEPLPVHDIAGYAELKLRCPWQRWSTGEHLYSKWEFQELISRRAADILQPDANRCGGITEMRKICAMAETAGLPVIPHSNEAHNLAVVFSQAPHVCPMVEYFPPVEPDTGNELFWKVFRGNPKAENGSLPLPLKPGLGLELCEQTVARLQIGGTGDHGLPAAARSNGYTS
ncbi:MAG: L-rhamnonate dehydratase [Bryobacterales bacterium]|nr:L-rhamnonate dehydratase [Bryobacterales bacterium]